MVIGISHWHIAWYFLVDNGHWRRCSLVLLSNSPTASSKQYLCYHTWKKYENISPILCQGLFQAYTYNVTPYNEIVLGGPFLVLCPSVSCWHPIGRIGDGTITKFSFVLQI